jgi:Tol biopolymer transport system component
MVDLERGVVSRVSYERGQNDSPLWSPDGNRVAYQYSSYGAPPELVVVTVGAGASTEIFLQDDPAFKFLSDWTPDGRSLVYASQEAATLRDIWVLPLDGDRKPRPFLVTPYWEQDGTVSPDGRWMAYESGESGRQEVYVQAFPEGGAKYQVTTRGGFSWGWSIDGRQLLFGNFDEPNKVYAADVLPGTQFRLGPARVRMRIPNKSFYTDIASGDRLLMLVHDGELAPQTITVVQNWPALLKQH